MQWKIIEHREIKGQQDLRVKSLLREMCWYSYASYADEFIGQFNKLLKEIPRSNSYSADLMYSATQRNLKSLEVWKMFSDGNYKYKMYTINYIGSDNG